MKVALLLGIFFLYLSSTATLGLKKSAGTIVEKAKPFIKEGINIAKPIIKGIKFAKPIIKHIPFINDIMAVFEDEPHFKEVIAPEISRALQDLKNEFDYSIPDILKAALTSDYQEVCFL